MRRLWGFDDEQRHALVLGTAGMPRLTAVVMRASRHADLDELWFVEATPRELDDIYSVVEQLMVGVRSRKRRELLEGMLATLCTSLDGF